MELTVETVGQYLRDQGVLAGDRPVESSRLDGGVSNRIVKVDSSEASMVVKQPLDNLAVKDDWPAEIGRIHTEAAALRVWRRLATSEVAGPIRVPEVYFEDAGESIIAIEAAPDTASMWKADLLEGVLEPTIASRLGRFLGAMHRRASEDPAIQEAFASLREFRELRLDPYHRTTARRHPDVAEAIDREIDRLLENRRTLVHGDFSPKNVLVDRSTDPVTLWVLDFEVAHWGDPAFDAAFLLNHLTLKAVYHRPDSVAFLEAASRFREAYLEAVEWSLERRIVQELGVLLLARIDGKSPVEYLTEPTAKATVRRIGKRILREDITDFQTMDALVRTALDTDGGA